MGLGRGQSCMSQGALEMGGTTQGHLLAANQGHRRTRLALPDTNLAFWTQSSQRSCGRGVGEGAAPGRGTRAGGPSQPWARDLTGSPASGPWHLLPLRPEVPPPTAGSWSQPRPEVCLAPGPV